MNRCDKIWISYEYVTLEIEIVGYTAVNGIRPIRFQRKSDLRFSTNNLFVFLIEYFLVVDYHYKFAKLVEDSIVPL